MKQKFNVITSTCVPLPLENVDTDQIIPARFLKATDKKGFGVITLIFQNNSRLDIDIRDYVYYDESAYFFKCRVDATLSDNKEFVIGLKGLNNTILSS